MRRSIPFVVGVLTVALAAAACSSGSSGGGSGDDAGEPTSGGDLIHLVAALKDNWQLQDSNNWYQSQVAVNLVDNLVYVDDKGEAVPWLAESWTVDPAGTLYTFELKDGVTFSDGTPLDAAIVADNLDVLGKGQPDKGIARVPAFPRDYLDAQAVDENTVTVQLGTPDSGFIKTLGYHSAGIVARSTLDATKEVQSRLQNLIGSGPFVYDSSIPEKEVKLVRREGYAWPPANAEHQGEAYLDSITYSVVPEDGVRLGAVEAGQADTLHYVQPSEEERLEDAGFTVIPAHYLGGTLGLEIRTSAEFTDDINVRQAIQHGIDRQELIDTLYSRNWTAASSPLQKNVPTWTDVSDRFAFDPEKSNSLLDASGWTSKGPDGIRTKDGKRLSFPVYPSPIINTSANELQLISQQLAKIGIGLEIQPTDVSSYTQQTTRDDLALYQSHFTALDVSYLRAWYSTAGANRFRTDDPKLNSLLDTVYSTFDGPEKDAASAELQAYLVDQAYYIPLEEAAQVFVTADYVHDIPINATGRPYFYETWLSK